MLRLIATTIILALSQQMTSSCLNFNESANYPAKIVGYLSDNFSYYPDEMRHGENSLASHVADSLMEAALKRCDPGGLPCPHMALINAGIFRGNGKLEQGPVTWKTLDQLLPFSDALLVVRLKGEDIRYALERASSRIDDPKALPSEFLHVSGLEISINCGKQPQTLSPSNNHIIYRGKRIEKQQITSGIIPIPLENNRYYEVLTTQYLADGRDGFLGFLQRSHSNEILRDAKGKVIPKYNFREDVVLDENGNPLTPKIAFAEKLQSLREKGFGLKHIKPGRILKHRNCSSIASSQKTIPAGKYLRPDCEQHTF